MMMAAESAIEDAVSLDEDTGEAEDSSTDMPAEVAPRETRENGIGYRRPSGPRSCGISTAC